MMKKLKKALALLLCLALCLGLTPAAFAEGEEELIVFDEEPWEEAIDEPAASAEEAWTEAEPAVEEPAAEPEDEPLFVFEEDPDAEPEEAEKPEETEKPEESEKPEETELEKNEDGVDIEAHFRDPNFRAYVQECLDTDSDGVLSWTEVYNVTDIFCPEAGITSLAGIEIFGRLEYLSCYNNSLTELDLGSHQDIYVVNCSGNDLTRLNLSECANLTRLNCSGNSLRSLDISDCQTLVDAVLNGERTESGSVVSYTGAGDSQLTLDSSVALTLMPSPPSITAHPKNVSAAAGATAVFTVTATGAESWQWQYSTNGGTSWTKSPASGNTTAKLSVPVAAHKNGYKYRCVVTNAAGSVNSLPATLTVLSKPVITAQPQDVTIAAGKTAVFTVTATGAESYQWQYSWDGGTNWAKSPASGNTTAKLSVSTAAHKNGYQYRCKVTNTAGDVTSEAAVLTVLSKPVITAQPQDASAEAGKTAVFTVTATGAESYQWQYSTNGGASWGKSPASGNTTATLSVPVTAAKNGYLYRCKVTNAAGTVESEAAVLTVIAKPVITTQPKSVSAAAGMTVTFTVTATGAESYQWQYRTSASGSWGKSPASGNTTATLSVPVTAAKNGYQYRCKVTNAAGTVESNAVTLTVLQSKPSITAQPQSVSAEAGTTATFKVTASGASSYQWQYRTSTSGSWGKSPASGNTTATLSVPVTAAKNGYQYRCAVTNAAGTVYSSAATLTVTQSAPTITTQPKNASAATGGTVTYTVKATGSSLNYRWQFYSVLLPEWRDLENSEFGGLDTATLTVPVTAERAGYKFRCIVSNSAGSVTSNAATLTVTNIKPVITVQPTNKSAATGSTAKFTVTASGSSLRYQWQFYSVLLPAWRDLENSEFGGINAATLSVPVTAERAGYKFRCVVSNGYGSVSSEAATLTVTNIKPVITVQPTNKSADAGASVKFSVTASGTGLSYQWQFESPLMSGWHDAEGSAFSGAKTRTLTAPADPLNDGYKFRCVVSNSYGSETSDYATLTVRGVTVTSVTFPDDYFRSYVATYIDSDGDAVLTAEECSAVTSLNFFEQGITSLKGVEYFTALTRLSCSGNSLTSLDLSRNTALTYLDCSSNQLTSLDLSHNTALTDLTCYGNQLTSLDLSKNTAIVKLYCQDNQLTSLDVSKLSMLQQLGCSYNPLSSLNLKSNPALTYLSVENCQLSSLDVSSNPAMMWLYLDGCGITSINVQANTDLRGIHFNNCAVSSIDLSQNGELRYLECKNSRITQLDVSACPHLTNANISCDSGVTIIR